MRLYIPTYNLLRFLKGCVFYILVATGLIMVAMGLYGMVNYLKTGY